MESGMKKILLLMLALVMMLGTVVSFGEYEAFIRVITPTKIQELDSDQTGVFKVQLKNIGNYGAQPLTIRIGGEHPFRSDSSELVKDIRYVGVRTEHTVEFNVTPNPLALDKIYEFDLVFSYADDTGARKSNTEKAYVKINNKQTEPIISIVDTQTNVSPAVPNQPNSLNLSLKNSGTLSANKVKATLSGLSGDGIYLNNDSDTKVIDIIRPNSTVVLNYQFKASDKLKTGVQTLTLNLEYNDDYGRQMKRDLQVFVPVEVKEGGKGVESHKIVISDIVAPSSVVEEQDFSVTFKVKNEGEKEIKDLQINFEHTESFVAKKNSRVYVDLAPGESKDIQVDLKVKKGIAEGTVHTYINATAELDGAAKSIQKEYVGIYANAKDDKVSRGNRPKLIIQKYEYGGRVKAGEEFDLVLDIKNTSTSQFTKNIKLIFTSSDGTFTPVNSSSSLFVDKIAPGDVAQVKMRYKTKVDADVQIYTVGVKMEYEDGDGKAFDAQNNPFSESENLSLYVVQEAILSVNDPFINPEIYVGDRFDVDVQFYNEGKVKIRNLKVKIEGIPVRENSYYVGNFDPGQNDTFSVSLTSEEEGDVTGKFVFEFESPTGEIQTIEKEISYYVLPASDRPVDRNDGANVPGGDVEKPVENKANNSLYMWIVAAVLLVVLIIVIVVVKNRKKKRNLKALEEMFDE